MRAADADRDAVARSSTRPFAEGRLDVERARRAGRRGVRGQDDWATWSPLTADLPAPYAAAGAAATPPAGRRAAVPHQRPRRRRPVRWAPAVRWAWLSWCACVIWGAIAARATATVF